MGNYTSRAFRNYEITKDEHDYLLPAYGRCREDNGFRILGDGPFIVNIGAAYAFCGTEEDYREMQERCKYLH